jgi:autoinducer 2 (AI-2) kinase
VAESSALGAAIAAGIGVGIYSSHLDVPGLRDRLRTVEPNKTSADFYVESYERWQTLYERHLAIAEAGHSQPMWRAAGADRSNDQPHNKATTPTRSKPHA